MIAGLYIRVSTTKELQESSLEYQQALCSDFINDNNFELYGVYKDIFTGTKTGRYNKRPGYQNLINDAKEGKIDVIIAKDLSRLSRNTFELEILRDLIKSDKIHLITLDGAVDSTIGNIHYLSTYILLYSEEARMISVRVEQSKKTMAKNGLFIGSKPPYGYYYYKGKLYVKDDDSPNVVQNIFNNFIGGKSAEAIARDLTENNVPTPSQLYNAKNVSSKWHGSTVRDILKNQHYIGDLAQGKSKAVNSRNKNRLEKNKDDYIIVKNTHEAIISKEQFNLIQDIINSRKPTSKVSRKTHLLSNLIYCETCGRAISLRNNDYICSGRLKHGKKVCCTEKIKKIDLVNLLTKNIIEKIDNCESDFLLKYVERKLNKNISKYKSTLNNLHTEKNKLENRKKEALNIHLDGCISRDEYNMVVTESNNDIDNILKNIHSIESMLSVKDKIDLSRDFNLLKSRITKSVSLNPEILNYFIKRIEVTKLGEPKIYYRF
ncbi:recombinase family protein [Clostridioides difficile]|nr:recombinase family protein [Clostridioides difficile]NJK15577.1 recombinase family protein [Clostridioides difficile]